jgi:hypothetical protein
VHLPISEADPAFGRSHARCTRPPWFRVEAFNVFNHTQFNSIGSGGNNYVCTTPGANCLASDSTNFNFLHALGAHDPRILQLGLKYVF